MGKFKSILALEPVLCRALFDCWIAYSFLYLRENAWQRLPPQYRSLSAQIFVAQFYRFQRQVRWGIAVCCISDRALAESSQQSSFDVNLSNLSSGPCRSPYCVVLFFHDRLVVGPQDSRRTTPA